MSDARGLLFCTVIFITAATPLSEPVCRGQATRRPNVLFLVIDDLNDWVGCLGGHPQARTPRIDALAAQGTLFTNAHCQAPLCGPSRASLLSGLYPHTTGVYQQPGKPGIHVDAQHFAGHLLPEYFAAHGYETFAAGKITHGYPHQSAFQHYGGNYGGSGPKPGGNTVRFNYLPDLAVPYTGTQTDWGAFPDTDEQMPDHQVADWAMQQLRRDHSKPFFLAVGLVRPHVPFYVPAKWFEMHPLDQVVLPDVPASDLEDVPSIGRRLHEMPRYPQFAWLQQNNQEQLRKCVQAYLACTTFVDHQVGRVLDALEASPYADNTLVVLLSDHGYHLGEKLRVCKHGLWEESTRVPLIIARPDQRAGRRCKKPVGMIDLYPTLLELCGLPARAANEGQSLVPLLNNPQAPWRFSTLTTYGRENHALRSERFRYIRYEDGSEELYDHRSDPHEWANVVDHEEYAPTRERFRAELPEHDAPYHQATSTAAVNPWFEEHFIRHGAAQPPRLFDGRTLKNWMYLDGEPVTTGWEVVDGMIHLKGGEGRSGHIVTRHPYGDFQLTFEWKIARGGNSGLKYRVRDYGNRALGIEYQILDDPNYPGGELPSRNKCAAIYDLYEPNELKQLKPLGEFNLSRIVVQGDRIEHWLNGQRIASATVGSEEWERRISTSKFADVENFGRNRFGRIMLTDHGSEVWYRNIHLTPVSP